MPIVTWRCQQRGPSQEDGLGDLGLGARGRAPELVKVDVEPFVNGLVDRVVLVANLFGTETCIRKAGSCQPFG